MQIVVLKYIFWIILFTTSAPINLIYEKEQADYPEISHQKHYKSQMKTFILD